jgi:HNH endonuclease.
MRYSKILLEPIVKESKSTSEVMRKLGLALAGGTNSHLNRLFKKFSIDTSHFIGQSSNKGKSDPKKLICTEILVFNRNNNRKESTFRLRRAMVEYGILEQCFQCGIEAEWNGKPIVLQIDHKDGNPLNNMPSNVRFLCPNCHSQTPTFGIKNRKTLSLIEEIQRIEDRECMKALKRAINNKT